MAPSKKNQTDHAALRRFIRTHGADYLADPNISSVGIGHKVVDGRTTNTVSVQFTVHTKMPPEDIEAAGSGVIPEAITVEAVEVPTDVLERSYQPAYAVVPEAQSSERTSRVDPLVPGVSIAHPSVSAGTAGCIVRGADDGKPYVLSNWHVLHGAEGRIGDDVVQPGPHDDNRTDRNRLGTLVRSHLGVAGDCAIASIEGRGIEPSILDLGVAPEQMGEPELGDKVVKSGRTSGVTHGVVTRVDTIVKLDYGEGLGAQTIGGFEIGVDPARNSGAKLSEGGDSGAAWLFKAGNGRPSRVLAGLHFGGEATGSAEQHALACLPRSVFGKLGITLSGGVSEAIEAAAGPQGFDTGFLAQPVELPTLDETTADDAVEVDGSTVIPYTHFSLTMSASRRFARWVAWNVDGGDLKKLSRSSMKFRLDPRVPKESQVGEELYSDNRIDRGHLARRADLCWGPDAAQANSDSFFFTNITPQVDDFNQSSKKGIWGELENAVFSDVEVDRLRISVLGGPVLGENDREYRGVHLPREYWKVICFVESEQLKARAFLLTQDLERLESLELGEFKTYQVGLADLSERTGVLFPDALSAAVTEAVAEPTLVTGPQDITW